MSDRVGRKRLIVGGMIVQGVALFVLAVFRGFAAWLFAAGIIAALRMPETLPARQRLGLIRERR